MFRTKSLKGNTLTKIAETTLVILSRKICFYHKKPTLSETLKLVLLQDAAKSLRCV